MQLIAIVFFVAAVVNAVLTLRLGGPVDRLISRADDYLEIARGEKAGTAGTAEEAEAEPANKLIFSHSLIPQQNFKVATSSRTRPSLLV